MIADSDCLSSRPRLLVINSLDDDGLPRWADVVR